MVSFNSDRYWLLGNWGNKCNLFPRSGISAVGNGPGFISFSVKRCSGNSPVWINGLQSNSAAFELVKGRILESTTASMFPIAFRAVDELLFRERGKFIG